MTGLVPRILRTIVAAVGYLPLLPGPVVTQTPAQPERWWAGIDTLPAGVTVLEIDSLYAVRGTTAGELRIQIELMGPEVDGARSQGSHRDAWRTYLRFDRDDQRHCRTSSVTAFVRSVITMPYWMHEGEAPEALRTDWAEYLANLRRHEEGHREVALESIRGWRERVESVSAPNCDELLDRISDLQTQSTSEMWEAHEMYDERTDHGLLQGAVWPPRS